MTVEVVSAPPSDARFVQTLHMLALLAQVERNG